MKILDTRILIGINIVLPEDWIIDLDSQLMTLLKCIGIQIDIFIIVKNTKRRIPIYIKEKTIILFQSQIFVVVIGCKGNNPNLPNYDMIYKLLDQNNFISFAHLISNKMKMVIIENSLDKNVIIQGK